MPFPLIPLWLELQQQQFPIPRQHRFDPTHTISNCPSNILVNLVPSCAVDPLAGVYLGKLCHFPTQRFMCQTAKDDDFIGEANISHLTGERSCSLLSCMLFLLGAVLRGTKLSYARWEGHSERRIVVEIVPYKAAWPVGHETKKAFGVNLVQIPQKHPPNQMTTR